MMIELIRDNSEDCMEGKAVDDKIVDISNGGQGDTV